MVKEYRIVLKHGITGEPWDGPLYDTESMPPDTFDWTPSLHVAQVRVQKIMNGTHARSMYAEIESREITSEVTEISEGPQRRVGYRTITGDSAIRLDIEVNQFLRKRRAAAIRLVTPSLMLGTEYRAASYIATIVYEYDEESE